MQRILVLLLVIVSSHLASAQQDIAFHFAHEGKLVYGTLSLPSGQGPFTTIVMNPGTGVADRDVTIVLNGDNAVCLYPDLIGDTLRPFRDMARVLVDSGFAVLRYDKLEYTYPNPITLLPLTFRKLWLPVHSAVDYIKSRPELDPDRIVLLGHSEGSYLVPYIARERNDVMALISLAGPRSSFDTLLARQIVDIAQWCDGDVPLAQLTAAQVLGYYNLIRNQGWTGGTPSLFGVPPAVWHDYLKVTDAVVENYNDAALPTLFIGVEKDLNVPPSELERLREEITIPADFWLLEDINHFLTPMDEPRVPRVLTDTIIHWLRQLDMLSEMEDAMAETPGLSVWPVPFMELFYLRLSGMDPGPARIRLLDMLGRELERREVSLEGEATTIVWDRPSTATGMLILEAEFSNQGWSCRESIRIYAK
jgi:dienelactone hydrolase